MVHSDSRSEYCPSEVFATGRAVNLTDSIGVQGELFIGAGLGEYNGGIAQTFDSATKNAIRSSGGWSEVFAYLTPILHIHSGYGIDSPLRKNRRYICTYSKPNVLHNVVWNWSKYIGISEQS